MRINLSTKWVLLGAILNIVAAQDEQSPFRFDGASFGGEMVPQHQSSVFEYDKIAGGHNFSWTWLRHVQVVRVDLMNSANSSILFWCPDYQSDICTTTRGFEVDLEKEMPEIRLDGTVMNVLENYFGAMLFFRVDWQPQGPSRKRDVQANSSYSQSWAVVEDGNAAASMFSSNSIQMTAGAEPALTAGLPPSTISTATNTVSSEAAVSTTSSQTTPSESSPGNSGNKSRGLTTGAIVGIVVGVVGGLILVSVIAGCFCFRRRRNGGLDRGGSRGIQDTMADKEAHTSILDRDQPDTPYSEQNSQQPLNRGLDLAGRNESGVDLRIGQAMSGPGSIRTESLHNVAGAGNRNSAVYSSLGGGAANSAHGTPVMGSGPFASGSPRTQPHTPSISVHDRSSVMGSPVPRASSQLDRSLSPYRDNVGHHHVVDGADLVQQEHSNNRDSVTVRSPSSIYSTNPLDEVQPISPESAREDGKAAAGGVGGSGGVASAHGPPGHGRSGMPSGISGQYAHLVEEGMTDEEIRRLEEEERALDEAIEQAGTTGRKR